MTTAVSTYANAPDLSTDDYVLMGVATCFVREEGEVTEVQVLEPIPSASALALLGSDTPTSYRVAYGTTLGQILTADKLQRPAGAPAEAQFCADFTERVFAAARTHRRDRSVADKIPVGTTYEGFKYSTDRKRVLNANNVVNAEDNVKQHAYTHQVL